MDSEHRSKDGKKSRREDRDHSSKDKDWSLADDLKEVDRDSGKDKVSSREKRKGEKEEHQKHRGKGKSTEKDHDRDTDKRERRKEREYNGEKEIEKELEWGREKERGKERNRDRDKEREREKRDRPKDKLKEMERERHNDRDKERERHNDRDKEREYERDEKEKVKEKPRDRERDFDEDNLRDREKTSKRLKDDGHDRNKDVSKEARYIRDTEAVKGMGPPNEEEGTLIIEQEERFESALDGKNLSASELKDRILRMKEERLQKKSEGSEIMSWVNKLGKLEERRKEEKRKAFLRSKIFEEQDQIEDDDNDDQIVNGHTAGSLAGVKVLHGLDKVMEGGSVVLTLKDQDILAGGDINEELDMLENVEIGEQKRRDDAYKAAKKKTGIYDDKFNDEADSEKKMLPQYDDPMTEEGVTLDASGRFSGEAEKKLEELRRRLAGPSVKNKADDLNSSVRVASDYYTPEEMLKFKKPKKKKSLRKKEKFDIDALEAEAIAAGLGATDLGSRSDPNRATREEEERFEAEKRNSAYQAAQAKADEASQALRMEQAGATVKEDVDAVNFADDAEDYQKCLDRVRKIALKKTKEEQASGPEAIALIAASKTNNDPTDDLTSPETLENKVVITEMEEFVQGIHNDEEVTRPGEEDFFMEEDEAPKPVEQENIEDAGGLIDTEDSEKHVMPENDDKDDVVPDETIHEAPVGKGIGGALKLFKDRGALKETVEWGGRNMDKKKGKLVGIHDEGAKDEIRLERTDEYGRILTPKEAFRLLSHKFHGKGPGKMKQEKRQKQYQDELKLKQMKNSDTPSESVERMREAQARMKTPYLMISGNVKPGQTSDPTSGFATVEKDLPGSLTPMLGDKKVEYFLGIKRKAEIGKSGLSKKPKP